MVVTSTRATGTTTYTVGGSGSTVGELQTAINTGASTTNVTLAGTDTTGHTGYSSQLVNGSLQITDLNNNNDLAVAETGASHIVTLLRLTDRVQRPSVLLT